MTKEQTEHLSSVVKVLRDKRATDDEVLAAAEEILLLVPATTDVMFNCGSCGTPAREYAGLCSHCGEDFNGDTY